MGPEGVGNKDLSSIAGDAAEGLYVTLPPSFDQKQQNADLVAAFKAKGEDPSGPFVLTAYAAVQIIAEAIKKAGEADSVKAAKVLRENSFETPIGTVKYNDKGDMQDFEFVVYQWHADGTKTPVVRQ